MLAVTYARVSTFEQAEEGVSLDAQRDCLIDWCRKHDHQHISHFHDILSGKHAANRPGLQAALSLATTSKAILVVYSLSRFARSVIDTILLSDSLRQAGAELASFTENLDTTTASGNAMFQMTAVFAEMERRMISERTTLALRHKRSKGEWVGRAPFGHQITDSRLSPIPELQPTIALIRSLRDAQKLSLRQIADTLNAKSITSPTGSPWSHTTVRRVCRGPADSPL